MAKVQWKQLVTHEVELGYPKFRKPDQKYNNYSTNAIMSVEMAKQLRNEMRKYALEVYGATKGKTAKLPNFVEDEETGKYTLKLSSKQVPGVFDAKGNVMPDGIMVGGGTKARVAFTLRPYADVAERPGITAMLDAVVITQLVEYKGSGGSNIERGRAAFKDLFGTLGDFEFPEGSPEDALEDEDTDSPKERINGHKAAAKLDADDGLDGLSDAEDDDLSSL